MKKKKRMHRRNYLVLALLLVFLGCWFFPHVLDVLHSNEIRYVTGEIEIIEATRKQINIYIDNQKYFVSDTAPTHSWILFDSLREAMANKDIVTVGYLNYWFYKHIISIRNGDFDFINSEKIYRYYLVNVYLFAIHSLVCLSIGTRMLLMYRKIYKKKR